MTLKLKVSLSLLQVEPSKSEVMSRGMAMVAIDTVNDPPPIRFGAMFDNEPTFVRQKLQIGTYVNDDFGEALGMMQEDMLKMHEQMHKIMDTKNPQEREKLMQEHSKMMQDMMGGGMMGHGKMGGDAKGGKMDDGMKGM